MKLRPSTVMLMAAGMAFALFPILRPWTDQNQTPAGMAAAFSAPGWIVAHLLGAAGFAMLVAGLALRAATSPSLRIAVWLAGLGTALLLPFFGAETFGLHGMAQTVDTAAAPAVAGAVRNDPVALTTFSLGLVAQAGAGITIALAQWHTGNRRWAGIPLALGLVTYLPQFFLPAPGRIAHGILMLVGALVWAATDRTLPDPARVAGQHAHHLEPAA